LRVYVPSRRPRLTGLETTGQDGILNLVGQLFHAIDLLDRLLPPLDQLVKLVIHRQSTGDEIVGLVLGDGESSLDGFLSRPVFSMGFSLDKDLYIRRGSRQLLLRKRAWTVPRGTHSLVADVPVPSQSNSLGPLGLFQSTEVELQGVVVKVDRGDGRILDLELFARVEHCKRAQSQPTWFVNDGIELGTDRAREVVSRWPA
jgi:hypothetical protein